MKLRLVKNGKKLSLLCPNGSILQATDDILIKLLTTFSKPGSFKGTDGCWNAITADMEYVSGTTLAIIDNFNNLIIYDEKVFSHLLKKTEYISATEYAKKHNKCRASVKNMCAAGRIHGAYKTSSGWLIPEDAPYPKRQKEKIDSK